MPIYTRHPEYMQHIKQWERCRHVIDGEDTVKDKGKLYLPMLTGQQKDEYENYKMRASFYAATSRTVQGYVGAIMRKPPVITVPDELKPLLEDITGTGISLDEFVKMLFTEILTTGRLGILCDMNAPNIEVQDMYERPYLALYQAEAITFWDASKSRIVLEEVLWEPNPMDPYHLIRILQYRELTYAKNDDGSLRYQVNLFRVVEGQAGWQVIDVIEPTIKGRAMSEIPFVFVTPIDTSVKIRKPPLLDMANINLSHYRTSADLEHGRHYTALPTPWVSGVSDDELVLKIGSTTAWILPPEHARAGYLEYTGQGLKALESAANQKEQHMAALGSRLLEATKDAAEAVEAIKMRQNGDVYTLSTIANTVANALATALRYMATWKGADPSKVDVKFNGDFIISKLDGRDLQALVMAWQAGGISHDTFLFAMQRADILPADVSIEEEKQRILTGANPGIDMMSDNTGDGKKSAYVGNDNVITSSGNMGGAQPGFSSDVAGPAGSYMTVNPDPNGINLG